MSENESKKPKRVTKDRLLKRESLLDEARQLAARAKTLKEEVEQIEAEAMADLLATGKDSCKRGGFTLTKGQKKCSVSWKSEFIRVASAEDAADIANNVDKKTIVTIQAPVQSPTA